jgi:hypothetical protein
MIEKHIPRDSLPPIPITYSKRGKNFLSKFPKFSKVTWKYNLLSQKLENSWYLATWKTLIYRWTKFFEFNYIWYTSSSPNWKEHALVNGATLFKSGNMFLNLKWMFEKLTKILNLIKNKSYLSRKFNGMRVLRET